MKVLGLVAAEEGAVSKVTCNILLTNNDQLHID